MNAKKSIKKYMKSTPILRIFLSVCWGNRKEKDIAKDVGYSQPTVRQYLDQLFKEKFVDKGTENPKLGQTGRKRVFYTPAYWRVIRMNIYPNNEVYKEDWELQEKPKKEKLIRFLNKSFERFSKIVYLQMIRYNNKELGNFNLENLAKDFLKYLRGKKSNKTAKYINEYIELFFGLWDASYLDESVESYEEINHLLSQ